MKTQTQQPAPYNRIHSMPAQVRAVPADSDDGPRKIEGTVTTISTDRYNERVHPAAVERSIDRFMDNPVMLYAHQAANPIGWWDEVSRDGDGIRAEGTLIRDDSLANRVWNYVQQGAVRGLSIGFNADYQADGEYVEDEGVFYWGKSDGSGEIDLLEISVVPIPANTDTQDLEIARSLGLDASQPWLKDNFARRQRAVVAGSDLPIADEERQWDAMAAEERVRRWAGGPAKADIDWSEYRRAFVWYDADEPQQFESYKLPIADVIDGQLRAIWRAVAAAAAVAGARGGVDIPRDEMDDVKAILRRYYRKFDKEWPQELDASGAQLELTDILWEADEPLIYEQVRLIRDVRKVKALAADIRNIGRSFRDRPSPVSVEYTEQLGEVVSAVSEIADDVKTLQRAAIEAAGEDSFAVAFGDSEAKAFRQKLRG